MKKLLVAGALLAGLLAFTGSTQAHGRKGCASDCGSPCGAPTPCAAPAPPPPPQYTEKVVTCYRTEWREKQVECVVNRMVSHEEVRKNTCTVCVPVWAEEKRTITEYKSVAKVIEKEVVVCRAVPVETPCGGCGECGGCDSGCGHRGHRLGHRHGCGNGCGNSCQTTCNYVRETKKVPCTVYECVPMKREVTVKVCHYERQQKNYETKCLVWECRPEKVMKTVRYCERVPYQTTIKVPVCAPCNTCCDTGCGHQRHRLLGGHRHNGCGEGCCG